MAEIKDVSDSIAQVYARSLIELASERGVVDEIEEEFSGLVSYIDADADFAAFLTSASVDDTARGRSLEKLFAGRMSELLLGTLQVLNTRGRCELIPAVYERYHHLLEVLRGQCEVQVTSAVPLSEGLLAQLEERLSAYIGKQALVVVDVDPDIIGGLVIRIEDQQIDASVRRRLAGLRGALSERAGKEIHAGRKHFDVEAS